MADNKKVPDGSSAEAVVRKQMEAQYGNGLKSIQFRKSWYASAGAREFWEVEGTLVRKKGLLGLSKESRVFKYQIDPLSGNIIGHEEMSPV